MKTLVGITSILLLTAVSCAPNYSVKPTITHDLIEMEINSQIGVAPLNLDEIIASISKKVETPDTNNHEKAIHILDQIQGGISEYNYSMSFLLSHALLAKTYDCFDATMLFVGVAQNKGLPIVPVFIEDHAFPRWVLDDKSYINWEATGGFELTDEEMLDNYYATEDYWSTKLDTNQVKAFQLNNIATAFYHDGNLDCAIEYYEESIKTFPNVLAMTNLGNLYISTSEYDTAYEHLMQAEEFNPCFHKVHYLIGIWYVKHTDNETAISHFTDAINLKPTIPSYIERGRSFMTLGQYNDAKQDFLSAIEIEPNNKNAKFFLEETNLVLEGK